MIGKKELKTITEAAENLGWGVGYDADECEFEFSDYSPAGQDFRFSITATSADELYVRLRKRCDDFDCSEEAYLWLDDTGHGKNGAPHDMKDVYEDMEACLDMMNALADCIDEVRFDLASTQ